MNDGNSDELFAGLEDRGYRGRIVSVEHVKDLERDIKDQYRNDQFDQEFYDERISFYKYNYKSIMPSAKSIIIVAVPQPQIHVVFNWNGKRTDVIIPPTYQSETDKEVEKLLERYLDPLGYRVVHASLPEKLLAVHSGLAEYGKNNISYIEGRGSFHRPVAFYSDFPCEDDYWQDLKMMERCEKCSACLRKCPTGAISAERFLLHAERCITYLNEKPANFPFPSWVDPSWHNCLVGCLHCQLACPENKSLVDWIEHGAEFSEEETNLLLKEVDQGKLPVPTLEKLRSLDLLEYLDILPRNLRVFLTE